ncbi:MAG: PQQ-dependent sugar dehydrogenase [Chloroflexi bacterium]|nr:PQQ-dependent sugar dehydrogenase [Chloroflexota bacterium]
MRRYSFSVFLLAIFVYSLTSCGTPTSPAGPALPPALILPEPLKADGPPIPFQDPNLRGEIEARGYPVSNPQEMLTCLVSGKAVYGLTLQNTNVRAAPQTNACRVGRVPRGTLVQIVDSVAISSSLGVSNTQPISGNTRISASLSLSSTNIPAVPSIGYVEDIQPIFLRNCNSCHSAAAKTAGLQVTEYAPLLKGSQKGPVIVPGNAADSVLWQQVGTGKMPLIGKLTAAEKTLIHDWIDNGALEKRLAAPPQPQPAPQTTDQTPANPGLWLAIEDEHIDPVPDVCPTKVDTPQKLISSELVLPISCGVAPRAMELLALFKQYSIPVPSPTPLPAIVRAPVVVATTATTATAALSQTAAAATPVAVAPAANNVYAAGASSAQAGIQVAALNLPAPSNSDPALRPAGGFCLDQRLPNLKRGITALAFDPNGTLYVADDMPLDEHADPLILNDAYHPSRSISVYNPANSGSLSPIFSESSRITGMTYYNGALYISRAGEVGRIPDGGKYERLAIGFAVQSQLFHANDGIAISNNWLYISAGGIHDGYSDGPVVGIGEAAAQAYASGGNRFAARLVRAPLDALLSQRSIETFQTAVRGVRNPYGLTVDPSGQLWFTDNGASNVPDAISAGDEVNLFNPNTTVPGTPDDATPYYGFPLALSGSTPDWYTSPIITMPNSAAPTGITWAYGTIFYGQYGRDPGLYRLARAADGKIVTERIMQIWPLLAVTTAPDGALWLGTGTGGLFRMTPGC